MGMKLYVGNLSFSVQSNDLTVFFEDFGTVNSVKLITDRDTGRSKGFAFVEMDDEAQAQAAIAKGNGADLQGRQMKITEALPQESKPARTGGFDRNARGSSNRW
ncbi:MAG: RNA-binding protein [Bdellovibrionales bacterium]|nr:RNA-binding protein [Bdellovibrionales bacterium]